VAADHWRHKEACSQGKKEKWKKKKHIRHRKGIHICCWSSVSLQVGTVAAGLKIEPQKIINNLGLTSTLHTVDAMAAMLSIETTYNKQ
jgi:hypothetical protein